MKLLKALLVSVATLLAAPSLLAADDIKTQPVHFAKGHSSATIKGSITGYEIIDYTLGARAGQTMSVSLKTKHRANYFNVLPPGSTDQALFTGSTSGNDWTGTLPTDGSYTVRVYLMRSAARRNETAHYTLDVGITGAPKAPALGTAPASDAKVAGTPYHATGPLPCRMGTDASVQCQFGVIRGTPGNAEVHITPPGGLERVLTFMGDTVTTGPNEKLKAEFKGDAWSIEVNDFEHYTIPDAVINGG